MRVRPLNVIPMLTRNAWRLPDDAKNAMRLRGQDATIRAMRNLNLLRCHPASRALCAMAMLALAACTNLGSSLQIDSTSHQSIGQDSRAQHLILHFTTINNKLSIEVLTRGAVSSHYLVTEPEDGVPPKIYQFVPDHRRAFHAGVSSWKGAAGLNASSIGIEIVNRGYYDTKEGRVWVDFPKEQIDLVIELVKKIVKEHDIRPDRILGHSDIAPGRKNDPGPKFPWKRFADEGIIPWPDEAMVKVKLAEFEKQLPDVAWFQEKLNAHGFSITTTGIMDAPTISALEAFQMKYRQSRFDGVADAETGALLEVVNSKSGFRVKTEARKQP
jgi:N-acetylmuramoyl-L-alanine amidase